jgi:gliding motility-associated-like protein
LCHDLKMKGFEPVKLWCGMLVLLGFFLAEVSHAQIVLAFQGGEPGDTWGYTSTGADNTAEAQSFLLSNLISGTRSLVVGGNTPGGSCIDGGSGSGANVQRRFTFNPVNIASSSLYPRTLYFNWGNRYPVCVGTGWDANEDLIFTPVLDGVPQPAQVLAVGNNNATFSIQNGFFEYEIPPCVQTFSFEIYVTTNRRDELLFLDDVMLLAPALNPNPNLTGIIGPNVVCAGDVSTYSVPAVQGLSYQWSVSPAAATWQSLSDGTIQVDWNGVPPGTYQVAVNASVSVCGQLIQGASVSLSVTVGAAHDVVMNEVICEGDAFTLGNQSYTQSGNYVVNLQTVSGCDSIVSLNLEVVPVSSTASSVQLCAGDSYAWYGTSLNATGQYTQNFVSASGCDSIEILNLTVLPVIQTTLNLSVCSGGSVTIGGQMLTSPGVFNLSFQSVTGCDSLVQVTLTDPGLTPTQLDVDACEGSTYWYNGAGYTSSGIYTIVLPSAQGCDSLVELNLTMHPAQLVEQSSSICSGESVVWENQILNISGVYEQLYMSQYGCDSVVRFVLNVNETYNFFEEYVVCAGEDLTVHGQVFSASGIYEVAFQTSSGCDSLFTLNFIELPSPSAQFSYSIQYQTDEQAVVQLINLSTQSGVSFEWMYPAGATGGQTANPEVVLDLTATNLFSIGLVVTNAASCSDTAWVEIEIVPELLVFVPNAFTPDGGKYNETFAPVISGEWKAGSYQLRIFNRWGELVFQSFNPGGSWDGSYGSQVAPSGVYVWQLEIESIYADEPIKLKGHVSVIR